jgi:hypothetical protein
MKNQLRKLRLREGDIIITRDEVTMKNLTQMRLPKDSTIPNCPIVYCPGSVHRLSKEYLQKLLERAS